MNIAQWVEVRPADLVVLGLTLLQSEWPKLYGVLAILNAIGLMPSGVETQSVVNGVL